MRLRLRRATGSGPPDYRQAASFALDSEAQTFVELEGGGKAAFTKMLRERLYAAYTWRVRHFREGETNETLIRFTPDGRPVRIRRKARRRTRLAPRSKRPTRADVPKPTRTRAGTWTSRRSRSRNRDRSDGPADASITR